MLRKPRFDRSRRTLWSCLPICLIDLALLISNLFLKIVCDLAKNGERQNSQPLSSVTLKLKILNEAKITGNDSEIY